VLILVLCFTIANRTLSILATANETRVSPEFMFTDLSEEPAFMWQYMRDATMLVSTIAYFVSEEAIMGGAHLHWSFSTGEIWDAIWEYDSIFEEIWGDGGYIVGLEEDHVEVRPEPLIFLELISSEFGFSWYWYGQIEISTPNPEETLEGMQRMEADAIEQQLNIFRNAKEALENIDGLLFYINSEASTSGIDVVVFNDEFNRVQVRGENADVLGFSATYSNVEETDQSIQFFRTQPAYYIVMPDRIQPLMPAYMNPNLATWFGPSTNDESATVYLAFTQESVDVRSIMYINAISAYRIDLIILIISAIFALASLIILLIGVGREYKLVDGKKVRSEIRFLPLDRVYLDLGLAFIIVWTLIIIYFTDMMGSNLLRMVSTAQTSFIALNYLLAFLTLLLIPPILLWLMCFTKRIKVGKFWRHTLIYAVLVGLTSKLIRYCVGTLWAGARLTSKVVLISVVAFLMLFFTGILGAATPVSGPILMFFPLAIFTPTIVFFLLRYAKRIRNLERGAQRVCGGDYDNPIDVGGGELGNIANSINNISEGIHEAVEERMKSERLKTELITNVSHDIRTPLTSIITYTDLLEHEGLDCEKAPEYLDVLKKKSLRLKSLTDELFEAAKAVSGNIDVNLTELNIGSLIKQVLGELDESVKESGLDIRTNLPEKIYVRADGKLTQRILENLLSNVFKYSMPNSRVYLDLYSVDSHYVRVEIKNVSSTELNFDPTELTERFKRGDDSRTDGGSGLGLSIVESFVNAQGGRFDILIDGDLFKSVVTLPMAQKAPLATQGDVVIKD